MTHGLDWPSFVYTSVIPPIGVEVRDNRQNFVITKNTNKINTQPTHASKNDGLYSRLTGYQNPSDLARVNLDIKAQTITHRFIWTSTPKKYTQVYLGIKN